MSPPKPKILLPSRSKNDAAVLFVDDEPDALSAYERLFRAEVRVLTAQSGLHALELLKQHRVAVVVSDYWMTGMHGIALLNEVRNLYPEVGRILLTGLPDADLVIEARQHHHVLTKAMAPSLVRRVILREVKRHGG